MVRSASLVALALSTLAGCSKTEEAESGPYAGVELSSREFGEVTIDVPSDAAKAKIGIGLEFEDVQGSNGQFFVFAAVVDQPVSGESAHKLWMTSPNNENEWRGKATPAASDASEVDGGFVVADSATNNSGASVNGRSRVATIRTVGDKTVACVADWNNWGDKMETAPTVPFMKKICMSAKPAR